MEGVYKKESGAYMQKVIEIKDGIARKPEWRMKTPVNFELLSGEQLAVIKECKREIYVYRYADRKASACL